MSTPRQYPRTPTGPAHTLLQVLLLLCLSLLTCGPAKAQSAVPLGVNLEGVNDWGRSLMFADAMKHARPWGSVANPNDLSVSVDADGWPTQDAGVIIMTPVPSDQVIEPGTSVSIIFVAQGDPAEPTDCTFNGSPCD